MKKYVYIIITAMVLISCVTNKNHTVLCSQVWMPSYSGENNPKAVRFIDSINKQDSIMGVYPFSKLK